MKKWAKIFHALKLEVTRTTLLKITGCQTCYFVLLIHTYAFMINNSLKMLARHFPYFHCSNFKMTFVKNFIKNSFPFLTSSKFLLCLKIFLSGNGLLPKNDYRKCPLNNSRNLLYKKWSFSLRISSVNVTKSAVSCRFGHICWRNH